jgi:hypothetical protein
MKVLLMGNGSSVMDNELGEKIDNDFDLVYRINRFRTRGFEKNVGSKVNGWFVCDNGIQWLENETDEVEGSSRWKDINQIYFVSPKFKHNQGLQAPECQRALKLCNEAPQPQVRYLSEDLENEINSITDFSPAWPTTGLVSIQYLINNFPQIYIHGFDGHSKKYKYIHYYDNEQTRTSEHAWRGGRTDHNLQKEIDYMNYLKEQKKVIEIEKE